MQKLSYVENNFKLKRMHMKIKISLTGINKTGQKCLTSDYDFEYS